MMSEDTIDLFMANAAKASADVRLVRTSEELQVALTEVIAEGDTIFCPRVTDIERAVALSPERQTENYRDASICVHEVAAAIAETGSLVCSSERGTNVQAGLLPAHHVALVSGERIYANLDDFFTTLGGSPPTNITLETGPSRTADIELTLTVGVHGPARLTVIVFSSQDFGTV
jgi:L-lactate dehydrogenase complex protein LldG